MRAPADNELSAEQQEIRAEFVRRRGYWADDWQMILELAPEIMAAYTDLSAYAWETGSLDAKTREFMYIATTAAVSHIHPVGIRTHGRNALKAGATPRELVTVLALLAGLGIAGYLLAVEVLEEVSPGLDRDQAMSGGTVRSAARRVRERLRRLGRGRGRRDPVRPGILRPVPRLGRGSAGFRRAQPSRGGTHLDCR